MAIADFGVTTDAVKRHHFPHFNAFSTGSDPTSTTIDGHALETADESLMSDATPPLRKGDEL